MMLAATRDAMNKYPSGAFSESSSSSSDDDMDESPAPRIKDNFARRSMMRYGKPITSNTMRVSYYIRIIVFAAAMVAIPLELVLRNVISDAERSMIVNFQKAFKSEFFTVLARIIVLFGEVLFIEALAVFLYLFADPLLGFKTSLVTFFGVFFIAFIKLIYQIPRPYWKYGDVLGKMCNFDFSGPSDHAFLATFFYSYNILIFWKYSEKRRPRLVVTLLSLNALFVIMVGLSMNYLGNTFMFESFIGKSLLFS